MPKPDEMAGGYDQPYEHPRDQQFEPYEQSEQYQQNQQQYPQQYRHSVNELDGQPHEQNYLPHEQHQQAYKQKYAEQQLYAVSTPYISSASYPLP